MLGQLGSLFCFATTLAIATVAMAQSTPMITYDANLQLLLGGLEYGDMQPAPSASGRGTFHLSMFQAPADRTTGGFASLVAAAAPLCLGSNLSGITELTLDELGSVLRGATSVSYRVVLGSTKVSPASHQLLLSLNDRGVTGFESTDEWPASVLSNANIVWVQSDAELSTYISKHVAVIGPQGAMLTTAASVQCLRIRLVSASGDSVAYSQFITSATQRIVLNPEDARVFTQEETYPLMGGLIVTTPVNTTCDELESLRGLLVYFFTNASVPVKFQSLDVVALEPAVQFETLVRLSDFVSTACSSNGLAFKALGEMSAYDALGVVTLLSLPAPLIDFDEGDADPNVSRVMNAVRVRNATIGFLDTPTVAQVAAMKGEVIVAPMFSLTMAFAYNLDGFDSLSASPCSMLGLLNGSIEYWDHPQMVLDNVGAAIPHVKVTRVLSTSSTVQSLIRGVNVLYRSCNNVSEDRFDASTGVWPFNYDLNLAYPDVTQTVRSIYGSLGLMPAPTAQYHSLQTLSLYISRGVELIPGDTTVDQVVSLATLDPTFNVVALPSSRGLSLYPFVTTVHVAMRASYSGNCDEVQAALQFLDFLSSSDATASIDSYGYTPLPSEWRPVLSTVIRQVTCDGSLVLGSAGSSATSPIVGIVVGTAAAVLLVFGGLAALKVSGSRSHSTAPKDESKPFAIVFTDVQSSTALWATAPVEMGPALDQHHALMRQAIAATGGYEVKTIGDSFMVAYRDAKDAVRFGLMAQRLFHDAEWPVVFDDFYRTEVASKDDTDAAVLAQYDSAAYGSLWRGLRVRIGVHYGHGQIKLDPVTQAYDYYGTVVNTAARVEAVGHGGQVCVTSAALEAAGLSVGGLNDVAVPAPRRSSDRSGSTGSTSLLTHAAVKDLGPQELYGLSEPVRVYQVLPQELGARLFPSLRLKKVAEEFDGTDDDQSSTARSTISTSKDDTLSVLRHNEIIAFFQAASQRSNGRLKAADLIMQYNFMTTLLSVAKATGTRGAVIAQFREQWRIDREPTNRQERHIERESGSEALQLCKLVLRIGAILESTSSGGKRTPDATVTGESTSLEFNHPGMVRQGSFASPTAGSRRRKTSAAHAAAYARYVDDDADSSGGRSGSNDVAAVSRSLQRADTMSPHSDASLHAP